MDWEKLITNAGLPGLMLGVLYLIAKLAIASNERQAAAKLAVEERIQTERVKVEDKKADALTVVITSLVVKMENHHSQELEWHNANTRDLSQLMGHFGLIGQSQNQQEPAPEDRDWEETSPGGHRIPKQKRAPTNPTMRAIQTGYGPLKPGNR